LSHSSKDDLEYASRLDALMDDARRFLPLSAQQFQILLALLDEDLHGYGILLDVDARTGGTLRLGTGTLYTALAGLEDDGLVAPVRRQTSADSRRRYYRLTPLGRRDSTPWFARHGAKA
jgi:DNA-binding PadR family transcriptional regulator